MKTLDPEVHQLNGGGVVSENQQAEQVLINESRNNITGHVVSGDLFWGCTRNALLVAVGVWSGFLEDATKWHVEQPALWHQMDQM